jgi:cytochrome d ubiquinol oxidase subunit I
VKLAKESIKIAASVGLVASLLAAHTGDGSAYQVGKVQPMKLAAMEGLYNGGNSQGLTLFAALNPFKQPDFQNEVEPPFRLAVPYGLSILATRTLDGYVPGVNNLINGYVRPDGVKEPSYAEKIERGKKAIVALQTYRQAVAGKKAGEELPAAAKSQLPILKENIKYFGYGYIKDVKQLVPHIPVTFWAFRIMVGLGMAFILFFALALFFVYKKDIAQIRWMHIIGIILVPLAYVASEAGWIVAEMGRQPWTIQDMLPVGAAVSDIPSGSVALTFFIFLALFTTMLLVEINILIKQIKKGPEYSADVAER